MQVWYAVLKAQLVRRATRVILVSLVSMVLLVRPVRKATQV